MEDPQDPSTLISGDASIRKTKAVKLPKEVVNLSNNRLKEHITSASIKFYHDEPKDLQVQAVSALVQGENYFLRAGTGYGKTRISEMYYMLFKSKVVVLVLNPLDSLGNDQLVKIRVINLTKMTLNPGIIKKVKKGHYAFVYLSPEVLLNSSLFAEMFFSPEFQNILGLIVIDKAHMIFLWGLVASRQSKNMSVFTRHEDRAVFRIAYGNIGTRLMSTNHVPVLMLSATCRPIAVDSIIKNLMLQPWEVTMLNGELTRPEIQFIQVQMKSTLKSCDDLLRVFAPHTIVPANKTVPTIIYSGTRNATFQVMKVVNEAHLTRKHEYDPVDGFIRRYHSCTGDEDKEANMADYADAKFPIMSSTMALGLGQNLKRVRCVIHMGRGDPASIAQMVGRCGRDGKPGLALFFMEATPVGGTCIRVSFAMDSKNGYVPLSVDDPNYRLEQARELHVGLPPCDCSICMPLHAQAILRALPQGDEDHLDALLKDPFSFVIDESIKTLVRKRKSQRVKGTCKYPTVMAANLSAYLVQCFVEFFDRN
ncbi:hypothetical protein PSTT_16782 [Puccinia striiformis]|uniref:DNA 3'-5' helicase n=1 Tax=Puccinia striiformis TaxID=27350 RepID=A0A2S4UBB8_9BASI|nr:hypothetical protein PSTT_16782 [Puccinia striiformis]